MTITINQAMLNTIKGDVSDRWDSNPITYSIDVDHGNFIQSIAELLGLKKFDPDVIGTPEPNKAQIIDAFELWDDLIARDINFIFNNDDEDIIINTVSNMPLIAGGETYTTLHSPFPDDVDVFFRPDPINVANWQWPTVVHELGHALGLNHPGPYNGADGQPIYAEDHFQFSVMSYFGVDAPQTPMIYDILAIQAYYGVDTTTRLGNTTYGFNSNAGRAVFDFNINKSPVVTIWDAGGSQDTLNVSQYISNQVVDLREGGFSSVLGKVNNVAIAFGTVIENAAGGSGNDTLIGNSAPNRLEGGLGRDTMEGGAGSDTYFVDHSEDETVEAPSEGIDRVYSSVNYFLRPNVEELYLTGTANEGTGNDGDNSLYASDVDATLYGADGQDVLYGGVGNDTLHGGYGSDRLFGGRGNDAYRVVDGATVLFEYAGQGRDLVISGINYDLTGRGEIEDLFLAGTARNGTGNELANIITGSNFANIIEAKAGNDTVFGELGNDTIYGGNGSDRLEGGGDDDRLEGGAGADHLYGGGGRDAAVYTGAPLGVVVDLFTPAVNSGHAADDVYDSIEEIVGSAWVDVLRGDETGNRLFGGGGEDTLVGRGGNDFLLGGAGADRIEAGGGDDSIVWNVGDDADAIDGGDDRDRLFVQGTPGDDVIRALIVGSVLADINGVTFTNVETVTLAMSGGRDTLSYEGSASPVIVDLAGGRASGFDAVTSVEDVVGGSGDDVLFGSPSVNRLTGGAGNDTYRIALLDRAIELEGGGIDTVLTRSSFLTLAENIENLTFEGTGSFRGAGNGLANVITGGGGADRLLGLDGADFLNGEAGADALFGGRGDDLLVVDNADTVDAGEGAQDRVVASTSTIATGFSFKAAGTNVERIEGNNGNDVIDGEGVTGDLVIAGHDGNDRITGGSGDDDIVGGSGGDTIDGGAGFDEILGQDGNDVLVGGGATSFPYGDRLYGGAGFDRLTGSGNGSLSGGTDDDVLIASVGDTVIGDEGADILIGTIGFQLLRGGTGDDTLSGGADADRFEFDDGWGNDRITDFEVGLDRIDMTGVNNLTTYLQLAVTDGAQGAQVTFAGQVLTFAGIAAGALTEDHFML